MTDRDSTESAEARRSRLAGEWVRGISLTIDGTYPRNLNAEARIWRRVMKVTEEIGEVTEALLGALGENPRKGVTHTFDDVQKELLDVAIAALGAVAHLGEPDPVKRLNEQIEFVYERLRQVVTSPAENWNPNTATPSCDWCGECDWCDNLHRPSESPAPPASTEVRHGV